MIDDYLDKLKEQGLKVTPKRRAVIEAFLNSGNFLTPEDVWQQLLKKFHRCGLPGIYRNLEAMVECGILTKIHRFDRKRYYGLCTAGESPGHHHHIVCVRCGTVGVFNDCRLFNRRRLNGFQIVTHFLQLEGVCADCQQESPKVKPAAVSHSCHEH